VSRDHAYHSRSVAPIFRFPGLHDNPFQEYQSPAALRLVSSLASFAYLSQLLAQLTTTRQLGIVRHGPSPCLARPLTHRSCVRIPLFPASNQRWLVKCSATQWAAAWYMPRRSPEDPFPTTNADTATLSRALKLLLTCPHLQLQRALCQACELGRRRTAKPAPESLCSQAPRETNIISRSNHRPDSRSRSAFSATNEDSVARCVRTGRKAWFCDKCASSASSQRKWLRTIPLEKGQQC
jgi:hypothetical protein